MYGVVGLGFRDLGLLGFRGTSGPYGKFSKKGP